MHVNALVEYILLKVSLNDVLRKSKKIILKKAKYYGPTKYTVKHRTGVINLELCYFFSSSYYQHVAGEEITTL